MRLKIAFATASAGSNPASSKSFCTTVSFPEVNSVLGTPVTPPDPQLHTNRNVVLPTGLFPREREAQFGKSINGMFETETVPTQLDAELLKKFFAVVADKLVLWFNTDPVFTQVNLQELCGADLDLVCGQATNAVSFYVVSKPHIVDDLTQGVKVVFSLETEIVFTEDDDAATGVRAATPPYTVNVVN